MSESYFTRDLPVLPEVVKKIIQNSNRLLFQAFHTSIQEYKIQKFCRILRAIRKCIRVFFLWPVFIILVCASFDVVKAAKQPF